MKLSPYHITSTLQDDENWMIVYSFVTGDIHLVRKELYQKMAHQDNLDDVPSDVVGMLSDSGIIVGSDIQPKEDSQVQKKNLKLVILTGNKCNLLCTYCGESKGGGAISLQIQNSIIRFVEEQLSTGKYDSIECCWFGGEPTLQMKEVRMMSSRLIKLASDNSCEYKARIVTNGILLSNRVCEILVEECKVFHIEITLDGYNHFNDSRRKDVYNRGYYNKILANVVSLCQSYNSLEVSIRCNVDRDNVEGVIPMLDDFKAKGINDKILFYVATIHPWGSEMAEKALSTREFAQFQMEVVRYMFDNGFKMSFKQILPFSKSPSGCVTTNPDAYVIDHNGQVYQCTEEPYTDHDEAIVGHIDQQAIRRERIYAYTEEELEHCKECPIYTICSQGCLKRTRESGELQCASLLYNMHERLKFAFRILQESL